MIEQYAVFLPLVIAPVFVAFWILILRVIALFGWSKLADRYAATSDVPADARRFGGQSLILGRGLFTVAQYGNAINVWVAREGLFLRPIWLFRAYHPLLRLPWSEIGSMSEKRMMLQRLIHIEMISDVPLIRLRGAGGAAALAHLRTVAPSKIKDPA